MRDLTAPEKVHLYDFGECPFCQGKLFFEGPHGGQSVNWYCGNKDCGAGFNLTPEPFRVGQLIHPPAAEFEPNWAPGAGATPTPLQVRTWPDKEALDRAFGQPHHGHDDDDGPDVIGPPGPMPSDYEKLLAGVPDLGIGDPRVDLDAARNWMQAAVMALQRAERDRKAACDFLIEVSSGVIGGGDEPIQFLIASHRALTNLLVESLKDKGT